jgi:RNA polymerase sigma-B factor
MAPTAQRGDEVSRAHAEGEAGHSGRLLLRMPPSLHAELARAAKREGVSLNAFITGVLSGAVSWRSPDGDRAAPGSDRARFVRIAVLVDLVLVTIAAIAAIALVIVAWP